MYNSVTWQALLAVVSFKACVRNNVRPDRHGGHSLDKLPQHLLHYKKDSTMLHSSVTLRPARVQNSAFSKFSSKFSGARRGAFASSYWILSLALLLVVSAVVLTFEPAVAQWVELGPYGKNIRALTMSPDNPSIMFAGSFGWGTFASVDGGATWVNHRLGLTNTFVRSIKARSSAVVICGSNDNIARSVDSGNTWQVVQATLNSVRAIDWDPVTGKWYAGTFGDDLYISSDDGVTWSK